MPPSAMTTHVVGVRRGVQVVGDHDDGLAELAHAAAQVVEHLRGRLAVEVAGRLVGEHDVRLGDQRAGDRHPLLLAAGELGRPVAEPVGEAETSAASVW